MWGDGRRKVQAQKLNYRIEKEIWNWEEWNLKWEECVDWREKAMGRREAKDMLSQFY